MAHARNPGSLRRSVELVLLALALLSQLALASVQYPERTNTVSAGDLQALSILCGAPSPLHQQLPHRTDGPLCPIPPSFDLPPLLPAVDPWCVASLLLAAFACWGLVQARAPPQSRRGRFRARGPPILI